MGDMSAEAGTFCKARVVQAKVVIALSLDDTPAEVGTGFRAGMPHTNVWVAHEWYTQKS